MKRVLLLSGGIDSTALLAEHGCDLSLFVDYGQPARAQEEACAIRSAARWDVPIQIVKVGPINLETMADEPGVPGARVIPGRNAILISIASNYAQNGGEILIGAHSEDFEEYHDCRETFFALTTAALKFAYECRVRAPFASLTKKQVREKLAKYAIEATSVWSCYAPRNGQPCGTCNSCKAANA